MALIDNRGVGRMDDICPHLVNDRDKRFANEFKLHKIFHDIPIRTKPFPINEHCVTPALLDSNKILH